MADTNTEVPMLRVGVISDTHGLLRPEALAAMQGSDVIIHAGDVGKPEILEALESIAPTHTVRGNVDCDPWTDRLPATAAVEVGEAAIFVVHNIEDLNIDPAAAGFGMVIYGHSHNPAIEEEDDVVYLNPGSAGPRRFTLPVSVAHVTVTGSYMKAVIQVLEV